MPSHAKSSTPRVHPVNRQDPSTYLKPGEALIGADGRDWSWCYVIFRPVARHPAYHIGTNGMTWRHFVSIGWRQIALGLNFNGYPTAQLWQDNKNHLYTVHKLILETFWGPCPLGLEGCHNNGNPLDNRFRNLRWDTRQANQLDRTRHGTSNHGARNGRVKLTEDQAVEIYRRRQAGEPQYLVARAFGINQVTVHDIERGKSWAHATGVKPTRQRVRVGGVSRYVSAD